MNNEIWVLFLTVNDYNSGPFFQAWFSKKPTEEELKKLKLSPREVIELLTHGATSDHNAWYGLETIKEGQVYG